MFASYFSLMWAHVSFFSVTPTFFQMRITQIREQFSYDVIASVAKKAQQTMDNAIPTYIK